MARPIHALTRATVFQVLAELVDEALARQVRDDARADDGAYINSEWGIDDPSHGGTSAMLAACAYLYLAAVEVPDTALGMAEAQAALAGATKSADYLLRVQRPTGLIDLRSCNYDSGPDTAFAVQQLCTVIDLGRPRAAHDPAWRDCLHTIERFVRQAVPGLLGGGFHTPNHRWVIASALAQAGALFPDLAVGEVVEAYLAEGFDVDGEGAFLERSIGVYDAVCDRSLLLLAEHWNAPGARDAVRANLHFNLYLLDADSTAETSLSRRQDYGTRLVPLGLAACYLHFAHGEPNPLFVQVARELWRHATPRLSDVSWLGYVLLKYGEPPPPAAELPVDYARYFRDNGIWRVRRGAFSASIFRGATRLLRLRYGAAELTSLKISQSYFGVGRFTGDSLEVVEDVAILRSSGQSHPRRPGYDLPLGRPVPPDRWDVVAQGRPYRPLPPCESILTVRLVDGGFELRYQTLAGLDGVTAQIALDFPPGGIWETDDTCLLPQVGQVLFLKRGYGTMRYGDDVIRIGPGADRHRMWQMRDAETAPGHTRVLLTFLTPIDHVFSLRVFHGLAESLAVVQQGAARRRAGAEGDINMAGDPFLQSKIQSLCDTPMQRKVRALRPLPVGVVVWQRVNDTLDDVRREFRTLKRYGFTALKQMALHGDIPLSERDVELAALEEGVVPWHYGSAGWQPVTAELLEQLGIDPGLPLPAIQNHPAMLSHQTEYLMARSRRLDDKPGLPPGVRMGEPGRNGASIPDELAGTFAQWLRATYGTFERVLKTYHLTPDQVKGPMPASFDDLAAMATVSRIGAQRGQGWAGFRQKRDILRFAADSMCAQIGRVAELSQAWDADEPIRTGIHRALENQAANGWDFELQARAVASAGSFYASFHPTHHLRETDGEMERPCYMTARIVADVNKGGWSAMWESVGGPQTYSGHYSYAFDGHAMERCMLSYLAAGLKGVGIWCWNARDKGWEIGEYSLCDLTGKPTSRAEAAGAISRACQQHRFELWEAHDQPRVGVLYSWENEAAFARLSYGGYPLDRLEDLPQFPAWARIGAMRALINGCVPWELVTERNLQDGLAARYKTIYVPHTIALATETVRLLREYVEAGGRVVADSPSLLVNADDGTLYDTRTGTDFERIFGVEIAANQSTFNYPLQFAGQALKGFFTDVNVTHADVAERFDDGRPAVLESRPGRGSAAFIAFEASSMAHKPGNDAVERWLVDILLQGEERPYHVDRPVLAYRRVAPSADHFFLINDRPERQNVHLTVRVQTYKNAEDCVTGEALAVEHDTLRIVLEPWQGRWVRMTHA